MQFQNLRKYTKTEYFTNHMGKSQLITSKISVFSVISEIIWLKQKEVTNITTSYTLSTDKAFLKYFPQIQKDNKSKDWITNYVKLSNLRYIAM